MKIGLYHLELFWIRDTGKVFYFICKKYFKAWAAKSESELDDIIIDQIEGPMALMIVLSGIYFGIRVSTYY